MTLEELRKFFRSDQKLKSQQLSTLEKYLPEQSYKSCLGVLHLTKKVGNAQLDNTCKRALDYWAYNYNIIERILKNGWDN